VLTAKGFVDQSTGLAYNPASYANHGSGLFFVGLEQDGKIYAFALDQTNGAIHTKVATIPSGFPVIMELTFDTETNLLWAACDDSCNGRTTTLDVAPAGDPNAGKLIVTKTYERPSGAPNVNNEGFAITPQAECVSNLKPVFYADDANTGGTVIRKGTINCTVPTSTGGTTTGGTTTGGTTTGGTTTGGTTTGGTTGGTTETPKDVLAPPLKLARLGAVGIRSTGRFGVKLTLGERANLTITATARKNKRTKPRRILRTRRAGVAPGTRTLKFRLAAKVRKALAKGEILRVTIRAVDAAGNGRTQTTTTKVP
jgi:hypothetical protein